MKFGGILFAYLLFLLTGSASMAQQSANSVRIVGQMKDVMWKGQLAGSIRLDTIADRKHLYGLGPVAYLAGEVLIMDGEAFKSMARTDTTMTVDETYRIEAPFFGYAHVARWTEHHLPDTVQTIRQLERYLDQTTISLPRPFLFRLSGVVKQATIHVVSLPSGSTVSSPDEAHRGQRNYGIANEQSELLGFFSTEHKSVFTHHDTNVHIHLITADRQKMGHVDKLFFKTEAMKLYLPAE